MRTTGNCRSARLDVLIGFDLTFPPIPLPDMMNFFSAAGCIRCLLSERLKQTEWLAKLICLCRENLPSFLIEWNVSGHFSFSYPCKVRYFLALKTHSDTPVVYIFLFRVILQKFFLNFDKNYYLTKKKHPKILWDNIQGIIFQNKSSKGSIVVRSSQQSICCFKKWLFSEPSNWF